MAFETSTHTHRSLPRDSLFISHDCAVSNSPDLTKEQLQVTFCNIFFQITHPYTIQGRPSVCLSGHFQLALISSITKLLV